MFLLRTRMRTQVYAVAAELASAYERHRTPISGEECARLLEALLQVAQGQAAGAAAPEPAAAGATPGAAGTG